MPTGKDINDVKSLGMIQHNAKLGQGVVLAVTKMPGGKNFRHGRRPQVESKFEEIRKKNYPDRPSRTECFYMSLTQELAEQRKAIWGSKDREIFRCRIIPAQAKILAADMTFYNNFEDTENEELIHNYWNGVIKDESEIEILFDGSLYFPDWQSFETIP